MAFYRKYNCMVSMPASALTDKNCRRCMPLNRLILNIAVPSNFVEFTYFNTSYLQILLNFYAYNHVVMIFPFQFFFENIFCGFCYYRCLNCFPFGPLHLVSPIPSGNPHPPPQFMSMGRACKFFGCSIFYSVLNIPLFILYLPICTSFFLRVFEFYYFILFYFIYSVTIVCIFSPSLHPTPASPTSLPHLYPPP